MAGSDLMTSGNPKVRDDSQSAKASLSARRGGATLKHIESLSQIDQSLLIGSRNVSELKALADKGVASISPRDGKPMLAVRADKVDLANLDSELESVRKAVRAAKPEDADEAAWPHRAEERQSWEIDLSKLSLKDKIASGAFGTVHRGTYCGQEVAVKLLDWGEDDTMARRRLLQLRSAFKQEVSVWSTLNHPNITQFIGASMGRDDGFFLASRTAGKAGNLEVGGNICCVVVEFLPGGTLKDYLIKNYNRKLPYKTVIRIALDLARGLEYLHSRRVVHRDTKTENLLMDKKGVVKITDFGVARLEADNLKDMTGKTGTLGYMAPEVLNGQPYNHKADVYSFGICLWEVYVCDMPFPNIGFQEMAAVVNQGMRPHIPRICPKPLADIMRRCWDGTPAKRPSMREVTQLLEAIDVSKGQGMVAQADMPQPGGCFCFARMG